MDLCEYAFYKPEEKYSPRLYCKLDNKICHYTKRCLKLDRFIPLENEMWRECYKYIMEKRNNIPQGSYLVQTTRPHKNGKLYLYVLIDDRIRYYSNNKNVTLRKNNFKIVKLVKIYKTKDIPCINTDNTVYLYKVRYEGTKNEK